jgi:phosphate butyryltransferase
MTGDIMMITRLAEIFAKIDRERKTRLVVAAAHDPHVLDAVTAAHREGVIDALLIGDEKKLEAISEEHAFDLSGMTIVNEPDNELAAKLAVKAIHEGKGEVLMKGILETATFMRPILSKADGVRKSDVLSSIALFELKGYHKVFALTDGGLNIAPDLKTKAAIIKNAVGYMRKLGVETPKVAALGAFELVSDSMPATMDGAMLSKMAQRGQIKHCIVEGPLSFDIAISRESARLKGVENEVAGDADILLSPNIEAANVLYKSFVYLANATPAAVIVGAAVPVVLTSRADSEEIKLNSIRLAASIAHSAIE